jgi:hypothetical protein
MLQAIAGHPLRLDLLEFSLAFHKHQPVMSTLGLERQQNKQMVVVLSYQQVHQLKLVILY